MFYQLLAASLGASLVRDRSSMLGRMSRFVAFVAFLSFCGSIQSLLFHFPAVRS